MGNRLCLLFNAIVDTVISAIHFTSPSSLLTPYDGDCHYCLPPSVNPVCRFSPYPAPPGGRDRLTCTGRGGGRDRLTCTGRGGGRD